MQFLSGSLYHWMFAVVIRHFEKVIFGNILQPATGADPLLSEGNCCCLCEHRKRVFSMNHSYLPVLKSLIQLAKYFKV